MNFLIIKEKIYLAKILQRKSVTKFIPKKFGMMRKKKQLKNSFQNIKKTLKKIRTLGNLFISLCIEIKNKNMKPFTKRVSEVKIVLSPSPAQYQDARHRYSEITGTDDTYENPNIWDSLIEARTATLVLENVSIKEAEAVAEPIRIMFPDQHVNIYGNDNSFIGNVTWNDQLKMFWGYPTYTEVGKAIMEKRKAEQDALGIPASWE